MTGAMRLRPVSTSSSRPMAQADQPAQAAVRRRVRGRLHDALDDEARIRAVDHGPAEGELSSGLRGRPRARRVRRRARARGGPGHARLRLQERLRIRLRRRHAVGHGPWPPVFIPMQELASFVPWFPKLFEMWHVGFEGVWRDTCSVLGAEDTKSEPAARCGAP